jgi:hypothetical protein
MTNSSKIQDYRELIKYALKQDEEENVYTRKEPDEMEKIYYHTRHKNILSMI